MKAQRRQKLTMRYEWLIGLRYLRARRRERFVSLIAVISLAGVALGHLRTNRRAVGDERVSGRFARAAARFQSAYHGGDGRPRQPVRSVARRRASPGCPGVAGVAPFMASQVMAVSTNSHGVPQYVSAGTLRGVVVHDNPVLTELDQTLRSGSLASLEQNHPVTVYEQRPDAHG